MKRVIISLLLFLSVCCITQMASANTTYRQDVKRVSRIKLRLVAPQITLKEFVGLNSQSRQFYDLHNKMLFGVRSIHSYDCWNKYHSTYHNGNVLAWLKGAWALLHSVY